MVEPPYPQYIEGTPTKKPSEVTLDKNNAETLDKALALYAQTICPEPLPMFDVIPLLFVNLIEQTAYLKIYQKMFGSLFIGKSGIGKTRYLTPLIKEKNVMYTNDITPKHLVEFLEKARDKQKNFLVVPDFLNCTSHAIATKETLIGILRSMTEEGIADLSAYQLEFDGKGQRVKASFITTITKAHYSDFAIAWKKTGFLSRLLPFSFTHSPYTETTIRDFLEKRLPDPINKVKFKIKRKPPPIEIPQILSKQLRIYEELLAKSTESTAYRATIQLISMTEALAVLREESEATQTDVDIIMYLCNWINYRFNAM
jgi:hypothetical protein